MSSLLNEFVATIVVSIFYRADECLPLVFESLLRDQCNSFDLEIFVCDDCSSSGREAVQNVIDRYSSKFGRVVYIRHDEHAGFRKTYLLKKAIEDCNSEIFVFFDGDCVFTGNVLSRMLRSVRKNNALCQGQRVFLRSESICWANQHLDKIVDFAELRNRFYIDNTKTRKSKIRYRESMKARATSRQGRFDYASGYFMALKTEFVKKIGMNVSSGRGYTEDTDFAKRLYENLNIDVLEVPNTEVLHLFEHH